MKEENQAVIKALNMYGRVPKMWELLEEIEKLTELCNKYEEEHKTTFETWQKDIKENELLHSIIKEVREYITNKYDYLLGDDTFLDHDERIDSKQIKHILEMLDKENK